MKSKPQGLEYEKACRQVTVQIAQAVNATSAQMCSWDSLTGLASVVAEYHSSEAKPSEHRNELGLTYDLSEFPSTQQCLVEKQIYSVDADSTNADMADLARLAAADAKTVLKIPLVAHDVAIGIIELYESRRVRKWTDEDIHRCQTLADHAAAKIENARLYKIIHQQALLLSLIHDVIQRTSQTRDPDQIIQSAVGVIAELYEHSTVDVKMLDETGRELIARGTAGPYASLIPVNYRQSIEQGIAGLVMRTGRSHVLNNVRHDPLYLGMDGVPRGSELAVPIQRSGKTLGVLNLESSLLGAFSPADVKTIEIVAGQLSSTLENVQLYAQTRQRLSELSLLHEIAIACATASDVDTLINQATQIIAANLYSDNFGFLLLDEAAGLLRAHHSYQGLSPESLRVTVPLEQGITGHVATTGKAVVVADVRQEPQYFQLAAGIRSEMAVPLQVGGRVFGVLNVESRQLAAYSPGDLKLLVIVAEQLSAAIERAQAQERATRAAVRLSVINEIGSVASATFDAVHLLQETAQALHHKLDYDYVLTALVNQAAGTLFLAGYAGGRIPHQLGRAISLEQEGSVLGEVAKRGETVYIADAHHDPRYAVVTLDACSELCVPICQTDGTVIGILDLKSRRPAAFEADDIDAIRALSSQLAVILASTHLHKETRQWQTELNGLHELAKSFGLTPNPTQLYRQIVNLTARLLDVEQCGLVLYNSTANTVEMQSPAYGLNAEQVRRYDGLVLGTPRWLWGEVLLSNDLPKDTQANPDLFQTRIVELDERNLLIVPLCMGEQCLGYIRAANKKGGLSFTADDVRLLSILAGQSAILVKNAQLAAESHRQTERMAALQRIGLALASSLDLPHLVKTLYHELLPVCKADILEIYVCDTEGESLRGQAVSSSSPQSFHVELTSDAPATRVIQTGQPLLIHDLSMEQQAHAQGGASIVPHSWLGVPLFWHGQANGVISVQSNTADQLGDQDLELISRLTPQVAQAIQNILSYQQNQRFAAELMTLQRIAMQLSTKTDKTDLAYTVVEGVRTLLDASDVRIFEYSAERGQLTLLAARTHYQHKTEFDVPPRPEGVTALVARSGEPVIINAPADHPLYKDIVAEWPITAIASMPIKYSGQTQAVLNVAFVKEPHQFTNDETSVLTLLANQTALAMESTALRESERRQRIIAETLREAALIANDGPDVDMVRYHLPGSL